MSGLVLKTRLDDIKAIALLQGLERLDTRPLFDEIGSYAISQLQRRLQEGVDVEGNDLQPSQRALDEGGKTLVDHGHLRDSYTYNVFLSGEGVEVGSDLVYSAIHHFGGETGRNHATELPARPVLGINDEDEQEIDDIAFDFLKRQLN